MKSFIKNVIKLTLWKRLCLFNWLAFTSRLFSVDRAQ